MKKSSLPSIVASLTVASGVLFATLHAGTASACPFAQGKSFFSAQNPVVPDLNKLPLALAGVSAIAATVAGVHFYRSRKGNPATPPEELPIPSAFPIPIPPDALISAVPEEEIEATTRF